MEYVLLILLLFILGGLVVYLYLKTDKLEKTSVSGQLIMEQLEVIRKDFREQSTENRKETQDKLEKIDGKLMKNLETTGQTLQKQFFQSSEMIKEITKELTELKGTNKQVLGVSEKLQNLENILKNPKQRGILGEYFLETLLRNVLEPNSYQMQYKYKNGEIVDAAVFFQDKIIPIDAKFSLEKYNLLMKEERAEVREQLEKEFKSDIKNRIDETSKYINADENTTDFSIMFIPAEGVYYNLLIYKVGSLNINSNDLIEYAFKKHVIIVSPTSFYAYLQTVLQGLKALKIEESVNKIMKKIMELSGHMNSYDVYMSKMGTHLSTTVNSYNSAYKEFKKMDKDILKITEGATGGKIDPLLIEKPLNPEEYN